jgi:hypothetical protein
MRRYLSPCALEPDPPGGEYELIRTVPKSCVHSIAVRGPRIFAKYLHGLGFMDDRELDLYFEYFHRMNRDLLHLDLILMLAVERVETLLSASPAGAPEESGIDAAFWPG